MIKSATKPKRKWKVKVFVFLVVVCLIFVAICSYFSRYVNPLVCYYSEAKVKSLTIKSVNSAVNTILSVSNVYDDLINITFTTDNKVSSISTNSLLANQISQNLISQSQTNLEKIGEQGISIPLGNFTGITLLSGRGPGIKVKIIPVGNISGEFISEFSEAGINQTMHRIYIKLTSSVSLILPVNNRKIITEMQVLVAESIIIGDVPDTYLKSSSLDEMLNLVPN